MQKFFIYCSPNGAKLIVEAANITEATLRFRNIGFYVGADKIQRF